MLDALRMESRALIFLISGVFALTCQASDQVYAGRSGFFAELSNDISVHSQERFDQARSRKTGAAVNFSHDYFGVLDIGEQRLVSLKFVEDYASGKMLVNLSPQNGLLLEPVTRNYEFPIDSTDDINLDVVLSSETDGKYYLNIFVSVIGKASTPVSRVFALAVYVGDVTTDKKSNRTKIEADGGIILVPVTEKTRS